MSVEDILFSPINPIAPYRSSIVDRVLIGFLAKIDVEFAVDPHVAVTDYERVAELIENDGTVFRAARQLCCVDTFGSLRPPGALTLKDVFARLHRGENNFYWTSQRSPRGIEQYEYANYFVITHGLPIAGITTGNFEVWVLGLLSNFAGYLGHYAFAEHAQAHSYWCSP